MSLRRKFLVLIALLAVTVSVNAAAAVWAIVHYQQAIAQPLSSVQLVLENFQIVKRSLGEQHNMLARLATGVPTAAIGPDAAPAHEGPPDLDSIRALQRRLHQQADTRLAFLEHEVPAYKLFAGIGTTANIRSRMDHAHATIDAWFESLPPESPASALDQPSPQLKNALTDLFLLHELIELTEGRILESARVTMDFGALVKRSVVLIISISMLAVVTSGFLAFRLITRWVLVPVAQLRTAAARIGAGDFEHRVPVLGSDEIAMLSAEVNHMASMVKALHAERLERERLAAIGQMVRRISHNLRNPLAGIRSLAELSRNELPPQSETRELQERILVTVDRFESWLQQLLNVTKPLALAPRPVELQPWLDGIVEALAPAAQAQSVTLRAEISRAPHTVEIDADHLEQALTALIVNAIEASPSHGEVVLACENGHDGQTWQVSVSDQGPGVPKELHQDIFRPYFTTKPKGNGIGLATVRQVVDQHGGQIAVHTPSEHGNSQPPAAGSVFVLTLPRVSHATLASTGQYGDRGGHDSDHRG